MADLTDFWIYSVPSEVHISQDEPGRLSKDEVDRLAAEELAQEQSSTFSHTKALGVFRNALAKDARVIPSPEAVEAIRKQIGADYPVYTLAELDEADLSVQWHINHCLPIGQPTVIAGPSKALKTTTSVDLAASLTLAQKFLGKFWVPQVSRVLFLSAESGLGTLQETFRRVVRSKGHCMADAGDCLRLAPWVPKAKEADQLALLRYEIHRHQAEVAIIDPVYQMIDGDDAASVSKMGQQLKAVADECLSLGATPILVHHTKKSSENSKANQPMELEDLAGAGMAEFFRAWILLSRRQRWEPDQPHRLWLSVGGSAGHGGQYAFDATEGKLTDEGGRRWEVELSNASDARATMAEEMEQRQEERKQAAAARKLEQHTEAIRQAFRLVGPSGLTTTDASDRAGLSRENASKAIAYLLREGWLEECEVQKRNRQTYSGYRVQSGSRTDPD